MEHIPLVSVIVITFNSADFVLETLDSVWSQSYKNLELIVSDDGSGDRTPEVCRDWVEGHRARFAGCRFEQTDRNGGIVANCNHALAFANGEWVKFIAGDDVLLPDCVESLVLHAADHPGEDVIFSEMDLMDEHSAYLGPSPSPARYFSYSPRQQLFFLLYLNYLRAPTAFIRRSLLSEEGGFDPAFPMVEDYPFWVKQLQKGKRFGFLKQPTVRYRTHLLSVSNGKNFHPAFVLSREAIDRQVRLKLAREMSPYLAAKVRLDIWLFYLQAHLPILFKILYPAVWTRVKLGGWIVKWAMPKDERIDHESR